VLLEGLRAPDAAVRSACVAALDGLGPPDAAEVPGLVRHLSRAEAPPELKLYALRAVAKVGRKIDRDKVPELGKVLIGLLANDSALGEEAARALAAVGPLRQEDTPALAALLKDKQAPLKTRCYAARALGPVGAGDAAAGAALLEALRADEADLRRAAAEGVAASGVKSPETVQALGAALEDKDRAVRVQVLTALAAAPPEARALPHLLKAFGGDDEGLMRQAASALARRKPAKEDTAALGAALTSERLRLRLYAASALAEAGPAAVEALEPLTKALEDGDATVRRLALVALRGMGPAAKPAGPALVKLLEGGDARTKVEVVLTLAKLELEPKAVVPVLVKAALEKDGPGQAEAKTALRKLGGWAKPAVTGLIAGLKDEATRPVAVQALAGVGKAGVSEMADGLRSRDSAVRLALLEALAEIGPDARAALLAVNACALRDRVPEVRDAAKKAAAQINQKK
jgi:HEAT repeat protein